MKDLRFLTLAFFLLTSQFVLAQRIDWINEFPDSVYFYGTNSLYSFIDDEDNYVSAALIFRSSPFNFFGQTIPGNDSFQTWLYFKFNRQGQLLWTLRVEQRNLLKIGTNNMPGTAISKGISFADGSYFITIDGYGADFYTFFNGTPQDTIRHSGRVGNIDIWRVSKDGKIEWTRSLFKKNASNNSSYGWPRVWYSGAKGQEKKISVNFYENINLNQFAADSTFIQVDSSNYKSILLYRGGSNCYFNNYLEAIYDFDGNLDTIQLTFIDSLIIYPQGYYYYHSQQITRLRFAQVSCGTSAYSNNFLFESGNLYHVETDSNKQVTPKFSYSNWSGIVNPGFAYSSNLHIAIMPTFFRWNNTRISDTIINYHENKVYKLDTIEFVLFDKDYNFMRRKRLFKFNEGADSVFFNSQFFAFSKSEIYVSGYIYNGNQSHALNFSMDGISYQIPEFSYARYLMKIDTLLNVLWLKLDTFSNSSSSWIQFNSMQLDSKGDLYFSVNQSAYTNFEIFGDTILGRAMYFQSLIKISDYSITRGEIFPGPYCAGDSFDIPYEAIGEFGVENEFIAQLSDEEGNFDDTAKIRNLGRIKTSESDTIRGELPLFEVSSSGNYRIRIISTHPPVQSFYRRDSLRLLIYSRDKAEPGPTETICRGDTLQMNTYGGTAWEWSPAYKMDDSTLRQPTVVPDETTTYRIVISDSSGCGEPDTAFKTIVVRLDPKVNIPVPDTTLCMNSQTEIIAHFEHGDTNQYFWMWVELDSNNMPLVVKFASNDSTHFFYQNQVKASDTILYQLPAHQKDTQKLMLILRDYCSPKIDTAYYNIYIKKEQPLSVLSPQDSAICPGTEITLQAAFSEGHEQGYEWTWYDSDGILLKSDSGKTNDNLTLTPSFDGQNPESYFLILKDNCSPLQDTAFIDIYPREPITVSATPQDTLLCAGQEVAYTASGTGGVFQNYQYRWEDAETGELFGEEETLNVTASVTKDFRVILTDGCMPEGDSAVVTLRVNPPLEAQILRVPQHLGTANDTTVCFGTELSFFAQGFGGDSSGYSFNWYLDDSLISTTPSSTLTLISTSVLTLILTDNCTSLSDTQSININILPPLEVSSIVPDTICRGEELTLSAISSGGIPENYTYQWLVDGTLIGTDSLVTHAFTLHPSPFTTLQLILSDFCSNPNDTFHKEIIFRPELTLSLSTSSPCANPSAILTATPQGGKSDDYSIQWFDQAGNLLEEDMTLNVTPQGVQTYTAILNDGCTQIADTTTITIGSVPDIVVTVTPVEGCEPLSVTFEIETNYPDGYTWSLNPGDGNNQNGLTQNRITLVFPTGTYFPMASITTDFGCSNNFDNLTFEVFPKPQAYFSFEPESPSLDSPFVSFKNLSTGALNYFWDIEPVGNFEEFEPNVTYPDTGLYHITLIAETDKGCLDTFSSSLRVLPQYHVYLPSAFSPNGDGLNDRFRPVVAGVAEMTFQVYNRWGETVFSGKNQETWDGTYKGQPVQEGIYVYSVQVLNMLGEKQTFSGSLTVLR